MVGIRQNARPAAGRHHPTAETSAGGTSKSAPPAEADTSWLLRWTRAVHRFEKRAAKEEDQATPLDVFVLSPVRKVVGTSTRFALTTLAIFIAPEALHRNRRTEDNPFLAYRTFVVTAIALYDILGGQMVRVQSLETMSDPVLKSLAKTALNGAALLYFTAALALSFWIAAKIALWASVLVDPRQLGVDGGTIAQSPQPPAFSSTNAVRMACFAMGVLPPLRLSSFAYGPLFQMVLTSTLPQVGKVVVLVSLFGALSLYYVHVTYVLPVRAIAPGVSTAGLWISYVFSLFMTFLALQALTALIEVLVPGQLYRIGL